MTRLLRPWFGAALALFLLGTGARAQDEVPPKPLFVATGSLPEARMGLSLCGLGDVDGDGVGDLIVGTDSTLTAYSGANAQLLYLIFAARAGDFQNATLLAVPDLDADGIGDLVVGAPHVILNGQRDAGVLYTFSGASGQGLRAIAGPGPQLRQRFGSSLALLSDVDDDGIPELAVGAPGAIAAGRAESGSVSIVSVARGRIINLRRGFLGGERLGASVASPGDLDGDGKLDIVAGAPLADPQEREDAGMLLFLSGVDASPLREFEGPQPGIRLGHSVAAVGDLSADGYPELIVGAPGHAPEEPTRPGSVYLLSPTDGRVLLQLEGPPGSLDFGAIVAGGGDFNGDGAPDFLVGAPRADLGGHPQAGLAQVHSGIDARTLLSVTGASGDQFGSAVAFVGDLNADGRPDVAFGAPYLDILAIPDVGAALVFANGL